MGCTKLTVNNKIFNFVGNQTIPKIKKKMYKIDGASHTTLLDKPSWPFYLNIKVQKPKWILRCLFVVILGIQKVSKI